MGGALVTSPLTAGEVPAAPPALARCVDGAGKGAVEGAGEGEGEGEDDPSRDEVAAAEAERLLPLRRELEQYVIGGVRMTVRDFCCNSGWTSTTQQESAEVPRSRPGAITSNHARPPWLRCGQGMGVGQGRMGTRKQADP